MAIWKTASLLLLMAVPVLIGWAVSRAFENHELLTSLGSQAHFVGFLYTIPLGYSFKVIASLRGLIGHKALDSQRNEALGKIVINEQNKIFKFIAFYILSAVLTVFWRIFSASPEYVELTYWFGVVSSICLSISILTMLILKNWDSQATELLARFSTEEKRKDELQKQKELQALALDTLLKEDQFSEEQKAYFKKARSVMRVNR